MVRVKNNLYLYIYKHRVIRSIHHMIYKTRRHINGRRHRLYHGSSKKVLKGGNKINALTEIQENIIREVTRIITTQKHRVRIGDNVTGDHVEMLITGTIGDIIRQSNIGNSSMPSPTPVSAAPKKSIRAAAAITAIQRASSLLKSEKSKTD
jgi:hypothetical protein